jgi:phosphoglycolate phosphatase
MLCIAGETLDPRLVVFDKDGTLIAFGALWHTWFDRIMQAIEEQAACDEEMRLGIAGTLGYDPATGVWDPLGPLTIASTKEIGLLLASQVYRYQHKPWDESLHLVAWAEERARANLMCPELIQPIGDVGALLRRLRDRGLLLALATTDDRAPTEQALEWLGISDVFATLVCGDDGIPLKPAPDMVLEICRRLAVMPQEAVMVGDTPADLEMARRAGFRCAIGVTSGAVEHEMLAPYADLLIPDIHAIAVV